MVMETINPYAQGFNTIKRMQVICKSGKWCSDGKLSRKRQEATVHKV
jgi:hypothetical protein